MMQFTGKNVEPLERNMMRGMYVRRLKDFTEEQREISENTTLLTRLLEGMKMDQEANEKNANKKTEGTVNVGPHNEGWDGNFSSKQKDEVDVLLEEAGSEKTRIERTNHKKAEKDKSVVGEWDSLDNSIGHPKQQT